MATVEGADGAIMAFVPTWLSGARHRRVVQTIEAEKGPANALGFPWTKQSGMFLIGRLQPPWGGGYRREQKEETGIAA